MTDPMDVDGFTFKPAQYLDRLLKEKTLTELVDKEKDLTQSIKHLDSEMQTLVYENYSKFISATDTVKQMKSDFRTMESQMDSLVHNMASITEFSRSINQTLQSRRTEIVKQSEIHSSLQKLHFLFELPSKMKRCVEGGQYGTAVRYHTQTRKVLENYQHLPAFGGIQGDTLDIISDLRRRLRARLSDKSSSTRDLSECVELLLQLDEPTDQLCSQYLSNAGSRLEQDLDHIEGHVDAFRELSNHKAAMRANLEQRISAEQDSQSRKVFEDDESLSSRPSSRANRLGSRSTSTDMGFEYLGRQKSRAELPDEGDVLSILEFINLGNTTFFSDVCLVIETFSELFFKRLHHTPSTDRPGPRSNEEVEADKDANENTARRQLMTFIHGLMQRYFDLVRERVLLESGASLSGDNLEVVRALDSFHRRLQAMNPLLADVDFSRSAADIISMAAKTRVENLLERLNSRFSKNVMELRQMLAERLIQDSYGGGETGPSSNPTVAGGYSQRAPLRLGQLVEQMTSSVVGDIKRAFSSLQAFASPDVTFATRPYFRASFCRDQVLELLVVGYIRHILTSLQGFVPSYMWEDVSKGQMGGCEAVETCPPSFYLVLSRVSRDMETSLIQYLFSLYGGDFAVVPFDEIDADRTTIGADGAGLSGGEASDVRRDNKTAILKASIVQITAPHIEKLTSESRACSEMLINYYVRLQGSALSLKLRRSIETRDWLRVMEPRSVRRNTVKLVGEIGEIAETVGQLYADSRTMETGGQSSDSSQRRLGAVLAFSASSRPNIYDGLAAFYFKSNRSIVLPSKHINQTAK